MTDPVYRWRGESQSGIARLGMAVITHKGWQGPGWLREMKGPFQAGHQAALAKNYRCQVAEAVSGFCLNDFTSISPDKQM
jgi:hypothetical protein